MSATATQVFSVFNAPSHRYLPFLQQQAKDRGLSCGITTLQLGILRSKYQITLRGDAAAIRQYLIEVLR